jgi:hypothetical protein
MWKEGAGMDRHFGVASAARTLHDREAGRQEMRRRLHERASADCGRIIEMIVEGLKGAQEFLDLHGRAFRMTDFPLDIVELEKTDPSGRDSIMRRGRVVYERDQ